MRMVLGRRRSLSPTEGEAVGSPISTGTKVWRRERGVFTWGGGLDSAPLVFEKEVYVAFVVWLRTYVCIPMTARNYHCSTPLSRSNTC